MNRDDILAWLRQDDPVALEELWRLADRARRRGVGDAVHLRGLVEISNHCARRCRYCGLRSENAALRRYRMTAPEILSCAEQAVRLGYGTIVLQSGEDPGIRADRLADVLRRIRRDTPLAITLSLGERSPQELAAWRQAGADRYLLRFETSNRALYERIHPPAAGARFDRLALLGELRRLGYQVGSGVMVGLPGQTYEDVADDVELFARLELDMIGVGPYIPHPAAPLAPGSTQVPNDEQMACKVLALARLACPKAHLPATTALATVDPRGGLEAGLRRGANVVMPNLTPMPYRRLYEVYPGKAGTNESPDDAHGRLRALIVALGRTVGAGRGDCLNRTAARPNV